MQISELKPRQGNVEITGTVIDKSSPREFSKAGSQGKVCNAKLKDDSGQITLSLWNEQVDQVKVGDQIQIKNGYVSEWQGEIQLSTGKFGTLEVIGHSDEKPEAKETASEKHEKPEQVMRSDEIDDDSGNDDQDLDVEEESID
ncbi:MAG: OB-fold nucleic acid binding domain-containing protein [Candidatus Woesearchaeota archaeon]|nr:OB-fold nucleic acid binding domain-containing protein [Candidatus Woesearchaeota archaeon]